MRIKYFLSVWHTVCSVRIPLLWGWGVVYVCTLNICTKGHTPLWGWYTSVHWTFVQKAIPPLWGGIRLYTEHLYTHPNGGRGEDPYKGWGFYNVILIGVVLLKKPGSSRKNKRPKIIMYYLNHTVRPTDPLISVYTSTRKTWHPLHAIYYKINNKE